MFEKAAALTGFKSLTEFILSTVQKRAQEIVREHNMIIASERDRQIFYDALVNPQSPNPALREAAEKYKAEPGNDI